MNVLAVPGYRNAGPLHWLTLWEQRHANVTRVEQRDWDFPDRDEWVQTLAAYVAAQHGPVLLAAHSLGAITIAHWAAHNGTSDRVAGALLVAPADVDALDTSAVLRGFAPVPHLQLPFPTIVVASRNDPWVSWERACTMGAAWGSRMIDAGPAGHLDSSAGLGAWDEGWDLLHGLAGTTRHVDRAERRA